MCEPTTLAVAAGTMAVAGAGSTIIGQNSQRQLAKGYENQKKNAQDELIIENRKRATDDYLRQVRLEQLTQQQEKEALAEKSTDVSRQSTSVQATALASAAERGVAGRSVDQIISDYHMQSDLEIGRMKANQEMKDSQHQENIAGYADQYKNRASSIQPYIPRPQAPVDYFGPIFGAGAQIVGAGMAAGVGKTK